MTLYRSFTDLSIQEFAALVARASAVVCGNTLPMHLADATGTPVVALYSGTDIDLAVVPPLCAFTSAATSHGLRALLPLHLPDWSALSRRRSGRSRRGE